MVVKSPKTGAITTICAALKRGEHVVRRLFTVAHATELGLTRSTLRWGEKAGRWRRLDRAVYGDGAEPPHAVDRARAAVLAAGGVARCSLAGVLHGLDSVVLVEDRTPNRAVPAERIVEIGGVPCADGFQTLVDLAAVLDDDRWEHALESALRKRLTRVDELQAALAELGRSRTPGVQRMRRVLARRPAGAPPTDSLLETLMVQLARGIDGLSDPVRQHEVFDRYGGFVARVDLCGPEPGAFLELDGQHHLDQPVYDARRETAVVAATGWLPGRFTWHEVVHVPRTTQRRLADVISQARFRATAADPLHCPAPLGPIV